MKHKFLLGIWLILTIALISGAGCVAEGVTAPKIINCKTPEQIITSHRDINYIFDGSSVNIEADYHGQVLCGSNSMYPTLSCNNTVILKKYNLNDELKMGDIIIFYEPNKDQTPILHRIIKINNNAKQVLTKGDNNLAEDNRYIDFEFIKYIVLGVLYT